MQSTIPEIRVTIPQALRSLCRRDARSLHGGLSIAAGALLGVAEPRFVIWFPIEGAAEVFAYLTGIIGAGYLITGGITLWKYLRENPAPSQENA
jgi:hypothetical protein